MSVIPQQYALTRPKWDGFHQADDMRIATYSCRYMVNPPNINCPTVYVPNVTTRIQKSGDSWIPNVWKTDIESDLRGINRLSSESWCDKALYHPDNNRYSNAKLENAPDSNISMTFAKLDDPPCTLRATGWNRFDYLLRNPQETFETPFDFFIPSRDIDKEKYNTHRIKSCFTPFDQPSIAELGHPGIYGKSEYIIHDRMTMPQSFNKNKELA